MDVKKGFLKLELMISAILKLVLIFSLEKFQCPLIVLVWHFIIPALRERNLHLGRGVRRVESVDEGRVASPGTPASWWRYR